MTLRHSFFLLLSLLLAASLQAQRAISAGVAAGMQSYENQDDDPRILTGIEGLFRGAHLGFHLAAEYTDLSSGGHTIIIHPDVAYIHSFGPTTYLLAGIGPTHVSVDQNDTHETWNAELELGYRTRGGTELFLRGRYYDYEWEGFRAFASPKGPEAAAGVRFRIR